jgi:CheY-like chemotaxis protein
VQCALLRFVFNLRGVNEVAEVNEFTRVIVIDDDETIRRSLAAALEQHGYVVDVAKDGEEAFKKLRANHYKVSLIDVHLPDIEGVELLATIKETNPKNGQTNAYSLRLITESHRSSQERRRRLPAQANRYGLSPRRNSRALEETARRRIVQNDAC